MLSWLVSVRHPFGEEVNPGLRPGTFASGWRRRHNGPTDSPNAVVDGGRVGFHIGITCEIEGLAHSVNIFVGEKRPNVRLKAGCISHEIKVAQRLVFSYAGRFASAVVRRSLTSRNIHGGAGREKATTALAPIQDSRQRFARPLAKLVEHSGLMNARNCTERRTALGASRLTPDIVHCVPIERNARPPTLLRAGVHQPVLTDIEEAATGAAMPIVRQALPDVFLKNDRSARTRTKRFEDAS